MNRKQAVELLRELCECCPFIDGSFISLNSNVDNVFSKGYQIRIKDLVLDEHAKRCINDIAKKAQHNYNAKRKPVHNIQAFNYLENFCPVVRSSFSDGFSSLDVK